MGMFGKGKQLKRMLKAGGNFAFVAQNVATIYYVVNQMDKAKKFTQDQMYYATALFDVMAYIEDGELYEEDIRDIVERMRNIIIDYDLSDYEHPEIAALAMSIEMVIFLFVIHDPATVISLINNNKDVIAKTIDLTFEEGERGELYGDVARNVNNWINNPVYYEWIKNYR